MIDKTMPFSLKDERENEMKEILTTVYGALKEKGYNPINQLVGYILSEDPTYITTYNNARSLIRHIDRDELLQAMVKTYLGSCRNPPFISMNYNRSFTDIVSVKERFFCTEKCQPQYLWY